MPSTNYSHEVFRTQWMSGQLDLDFGTMGKEELMAIQQRLGMGCEWGVWEIPATLMPAGTLVSAP